MPEDEQQEIYLEIKKYMDSTDDELNAAKIRQLIEWVDNSRKRKAQKDLLDKELKEQTENSNTENGNFEKTLLHLFQSLRLFRKKFTKRSSSNLMN